MANAIYPNFKENLAAGNIDWDADTITAYLIDGADYTYSASHATMSDVPSGARVANVNLASKTNVDGLLDAADPTFTAVTGDPCEILILATNSGSDATSYLIAYWDTGVTGLPVTPNGGDIDLQFNASGIIQL